jgi:hypothetical protein
MGQGTQRIGRLQVNKVLGSLRRVQLRFGGRPPAVGFWAQVLDFAKRGLRAQKGRDIRGQCPGGKPVNEAMAFITPGSGGGRMNDEANECCEDSGGKAEQRIRAEHGASIRLGSAAGAFTRDEGGQPERDARLDRDLCHIRIYPKFFNNIRPKQA